MGFTAPMETCRRAARGPIRPKLRLKETLIWIAGFRALILSKKQRFSDILRRTLSPTRRGPGSYQYRVKLERRGPAVKHPPGFFVSWWAMANTLAACRFVARTRGQAWKPALRYRGFGF